MPRAGRNFFSVNLAWNKLHELKHELKHVSVHFSFLQYLVQVLVPSAMNKYSFFIYSFSFLEYFSSSFSVSKRIAVILVLVFVLIMKIALLITSHPFFGIQQLHRSGPEGNRSTSCRSYYYYYYKRIWLWWRNVRGLQGHLTNEIVRRESQRDK